MQLSTKTKLQTEQLVSEESFNMKFLPYTNNLKNTIKEVDMKPRILFISDMIEENGNTVKENNDLLNHAIPIGTLVEISSEELEHYNGLRLFVAKHTRDCDGTPLYTLSIHKDYSKQEEENKEQKTCAENTLENTIATIFEFKLKGSVIDGIDESSLITLP